MSKRGKFLKTYTERDVSHSVLEAYAKRMRGKTDEEKEILAEQFTHEIEEKYPLREKTNR